MANSPTSEGTGFRQDVQRLGQGVDALKSDVGGLAHGAADAARSGIAELKQGAQDAMGTAKDKLESAKEAAAEAAHSFKGIVKRHPLATIAIVAGLGVLAGMLLTRSRN